MKKSQFVGVIFLDIKKAFDRVYLPRLLRKLKSAGVRGSALHWFRNFLQNSCQRSMIGQSISSVEHLHAGVPQDAILSPLLFSLYMNDITAFTNGDVNLFADDTSAFTVPDSVADLQCSQQAVADELSFWFSNRAMTINVSKTAVIIGSAEALPILCVRYFRWERERERYRQTDRERDGSDVTIVALKMAMNLHFSLPKIRTIGDELTDSLAKISHFSFLSSHFPSLPSRRGHHCGTMSSHFPLPKFFRPLCSPSFKWHEPRDEWSKTQDKWSNPAQSYFVLPIEKMNQINTKNYWK